MRQTYFIITVEKGEALPLFKRTTEIFDHQILASIKGGVSQ
jgi:hypothetical protein